MVLGQKWTSKSDEDGPTALPLHMTWVDDLSSMPGGWDDIPDS